MNIEQTAGRLSVPVTMNTGGLREILVQTRFSWEPKFQYLLHLQLDIKTSGEDTENKVFLHKMQTKT